MEVIDTYVNKAEPYFGESQTQSVNDLALYFQYEKDSEWGNLTAGGRYEDHQTVGRQFVPRIAITKVWEQLHAKVMYSKAFKTPQFSTVATARTAKNPIVGAEDATDIEMEMGYQFSKTWQLTGNIYQFKIKDYIAYDSTVFANITAGEVTTYGGELLLALRDGKFDLDIGYSNAQLSDTTVKTIQVESEPRRVLGIPAHKLLINTTYHFDNNSSLNLNGVLLGSRYACFSDPENLICGGPHKLKPEYDFNLFYQREYQHWHLGIGIANVFDTEVWYAEPYRGGQPPTPGLERRFMLNVEYHF
jgi:outer membrane receptor protein involved in Fe transport